MASGAQMPSQVQIEDNVRQVSPYQCTRDEGLTEIIWEQFSSFEKKQNTNAMALH